MNNLIETQFTQSERDAIINLIKDLEAALNGKTAALTEEERVRYGSINEQNKLFVNKVRDYHTNSPTMSAPEVDWTEFETDYQSRAFCESIAARLASLVYQLQSTKIMHDYDNYQDALKDYRYAQYKKESGEAGYAEKVAELKQFFNRSGSGGQNDPNNNPQT
jgi:hypothetical protein